MTTLRNIENKGEDYHIQREITDLKLVFVEYEKNVS